MGRTLCGAEALSALAEQRRRKIETVHRVARRLLGPIGWSVLMVDDVTWCTCGECGVLQFRGGGVAFTSTDTERTITEALEMLLSLRPAGSA